MTRLEAAAGSSYPGNLALGAVDDVELTGRVAAAIGGELAAAGVNLDLAPVADVNSDERNPIIGVRSFGSEPALVARHTAAFVAGLQRRRRGRVREALPRARRDPRRLAPRAADDRRRPRDAARARARPVPGRDRGGRPVDHDRAHPRARDRRAARDAQPRAPHRAAARGARLRRDGDHRRARDARGQRDRRRRGGGGARDRRRAPTRSASGTTSSRTTCARIRQALVDAVRAGRLPEERLAEAAARVERVGRWTLEQPAETAPSPRSASRRRGAPSTSRARSS